MLSLPVTHEEREAASYMYLLSSPKERGQKAMPSFKKSIWRYLWSYSLVQEKEITFVFIEIHIFYAISVKPTDLVKSE